MNEENLHRAVAPYATYIGAVTNDSEVASAFDLAQLPPAGAYAELLDAVLHRVTGLAIFAADQSTQFRPARKPRRWPLKLRR